MPLYNIEKLNSYLNTHSDEIDRLRLDIFKITPLRLLDFDGALTLACYYIKECDEGSLKNLIEAKPALKHSLLTASSQPWNGLPIGKNLYNLAVSSKSSNIVSYIIRLYITERVNERVTGETPISPLKFYVGDIITNQGKFMSSLRESMEKLCKYDIKYNARLIKDLLDNQPYFAQFLLKSSSSDTIIKLAKALKLDLLEYIRSICVDRDDVVSDVIKEMAFTFVRVGDKESLCELIQGIEGRKIEFLRAIYKYNNYFDDGNIEEGDTILVAAARNLKIDVVEYLLEIGAHPNRCSSSNITAIMAATVYDSAKQGIKPEEHDNCAVQILKLLVKYGADLTMLSGEDDITTVIEKVGYLTQCRSFVYNKLTQDGHPYRHNLLKAFTFIKSWDIKPLENLIEKEGCNKGILLKATYGNKYDKYIECNDTLLVAAARELKVDMVKYLLSIGADSDQINDNGGKKIITATIFNNFTKYNLANKYNDNCAIQILELLAKYGITFSKYDIDMKEVLEKSTIGMVKYFLDAGIKEDNVGYLTIKIAFALIVKGDEEGLKSLIKSIGENNKDILLKAAYNETGYAIYGDTLLVAAARYLNVDIVKYLLSIGADPNQQDHHGNTVAMLTVLFDSIKDKQKMKYKDYDDPAAQILELLVEYGADLTTVNSEGKDIRTIIERIGISNLHKCYRFICDKFREGNNTYEQQLSSAFIFIEDGNTKAFKNLMEKEAKSNKKKLLQATYGKTSKYFDPGDTLLMAAARYLNVDIIKCLLEIGADPNQQNNHGNTAATMAVLYDPAKKAHGIIYGTHDNGAVEILKLFTEYNNTILAKGAANRSDFFTLLDRNKNSLLMRIAGTGTLPKCMSFVIDELQERNIFEQQLSYTNKEGKQVSDLILGRKAFHSGNVEAVKSFIIASGVDVSQYVDYIKSLESNVSKYEPGKHVYVGTKVYTEDRDELIALLKASAILAKLETDISSSEIEELRKNQDSTVGEVAHNLAIQRFVFLMMQSIHTKKTVGTEDKLMNLATFIHNDSSALNVLGQKILQYSVTEALNSVIKYCIDNYSAQIKMLSSDAVIKLTELGKILDDVDAYTLAIQKLLDQNLAEKDILPRGAFLNAITQGNIDSLRKTLEEINVPEQYQDSYEILKSKFGYLLNNITSLKLSSDYDKKSMKDSAEYYNNHKEALIPGLVLIYNIMKLPFGNLSQPVEELTSLVKKFLDEYKLLIKFNSDNQQLGKLLGESHEISNLVKKVRDIKESLLNFIDLSKSLDNVNLYIKNEVEKTEPFLLFCSNKLEGIMQRYLQKYEEISGSDMVKEFEVIVTKLVDVVEQPFLTESDVAEMDTSMLDAEFEIIGDNYNS